MFRSIARAFHWLGNFCQAANFFSLPSVIQLFALRNTPKNPRRARLRRGNTLFFYRGIADAGVMSHFYKEGYDVQTRDGTPINWIVDLGANIGDETVKFALRHPTAAIVAVEPAPRNFALLVKNVASFGERVTCLNAGAWPRDVKLRVIPAASNEASSVVEDPNGTVDAISIPSIMRRFAMPRIDILKIDVEGADYELFSRDYETWLGKVRCIIIELSDADRLGSTQVFFRALEQQSLSFTFYRCGENLVGIKYGELLLFQSKVGI